MAALKVNQLPSLPHVLIDMLHACEGNRVSFQELAAIISRDAAITARVVALANSSFFSRGSKVDSLERALLVLGTDTIKTIVITASIQQFFSGFNTQHTDYLKTFWRRSLFCALVAKSLAILTSYPNPDEAYLTGLLHNIGELVLETNYPEPFDKLLQESFSESSRCSQEKQHFGCSHPEVGAWLLREWQLNDFVADAIEFHHTDASTVLDAHHLVKITYLSSLLSGLDSNNGATRSDLEAHEVAEQLFELNASLVNEIINKIESEVANIAHSMGIRFDDDDASVAHADEQKRIELAKQVRNHGLLQTAAAELNRANSKHELGRAFQSTLSLLFGYAHSAVFWYESEENELSFIMPEHPESVPLKFKLEAERSLVAKSALNKQILYSLDSQSDSSKLAVVDQQILRMVRAKGLVCVPIFNKAKLFCVLVVGSHENSERQSAQRNLLKFFAKEIAVTCEKTLQAISSNEFELSLNELSLRISELVHEANNPLNIINNYLLSLSRKLSEHREVQEELLILREEVERTGHILLRLKDIQHSSLDEEPGVEINHEIKSLVTLYRSSLFLAHDIRCSLNLDEEMPRNRAGRNSIRQVLTNLIKNAVEAMPDGGDIAINTTGTINVDGTDFTEITVSDNGPGIPAHILKDLFNPVDSTKGTGHSGLGLSITKNLIKDAQGTISCRSNKSGTSFQILLPSQA